MLQLAILQEGFEISGKVAGTVVRQQARLVANLDLLNPCLFQRRFESILDVLSVHR